MSPDAREDNKEDLILDILIHDINNANTIALGYGTILESKLKGEELMFLENLVNGARQSMNLIKNAQAIRRVQKTPVQLVKMNLGTAMKRAGTGLPGRPIEVSDFACDVYADEFLDEIFRVLLENVEKYTGKDAKVRISAKDLGSTCEVSVEDEGPGISDALKEGVFNRLIRDAPKKSRKGLGLVLAKLIVDRYGGTIRAEDRVPGKQDQGAALRFTLRKYQG